MSRPACLFLTLLVLAAGASAGDTDDEEARAEAKRTILRPLGKTGGSTTKEAGLTAEATAFVDLFLDLERNKREIRARRAPKSRRFFGTPHAQMTVEDDRLVLAACFVQLEISRAEVPVAEVPQLLGVVLDGKKFVHARIAGDGEKFEAWRQGLLVNLLLTCDETLSKKKPGAEEWAKSRQAALEGILGGLRADPAGDINGALRVLTKLGNAGVAKSLIEIAGALPADAPAWKRGSYVRMIGGMDAAEARAWARKHLTGDEPSLAVSALYGLSLTPDEETLVFMEKTLAKDSTADPNLRRAAVSGFERLKTPRAVEAVKAAFDAPRDDNERYALGCALLRMGSDHSRSYLEKQLAGFEESGERSPRVSILRKLLQEKAKPTPDR